MANIRHLLPVFTAYDRSMFMYNMYAQMILIQYNVIHNVIQLKCDLSMGKNLMAE